METPTTIPARAQGRAEAIANAFGITVYAGADGGVTSVTPHGVTYSIHAPGYSAPGDIPAEVARAGSCFRQHRTFVRAADAMLNLLALDASATTFAAVRLLVRFAVEQEADLHRRRCQAAAR